MSAVSCRARCCVTRSFQDNKNRGNVRNVKPRFEIRLHLRVFGARSITDVIANAKAVFEMAAISLDVRTENSFRLSRLSDVDLGTTELDELRQVETFPRHELAIYFLQSLTPPMNGACFDGPLIVVTECFTPWTLAHEIGHALKLEHIPDDESVMGTTVNVGFPPPDFSSCEFSTMQTSDLLFPVKTESIMCTFADVRSILLSQEPDYDAAVRLGQDAIPHLEEIAEAVYEPPLLAAKAVYLAGRIGGARASRIVASAAQPDQAQAMRIAAAAGVAFLLPELSNPIIRMLLNDEDYGTRKTTLRAVPRGASQDIIERLTTIANIETDTVLRKLAIEAIERQL